MSTLQEQAPDTMPDLAPLGLRRQGDHLEFFLRNQADILAQLPADYEQVLAHCLGETLAEPAKLTAEINLEDTPGISSRQLGALIALGKVLRTRFGNVPMTHVSAGVRYLLEMTRTAKLFQLG